MRKEARVLGPYAEGDKFRVIVIDAAGRRQSALVDTQAQATRFMKRARKQHSTPVGEVLTEWCESRVLGGKALEKSVANQKVRVQRLLGEAVDLPIATVTESQARALYHAHQQSRGLNTDRPLAAATHRFDLELTRHLWTWAQGKGYAGNNPWDAVEPIGRPRKGKLQLRPSEAARLADRCYMEAAQGEARAVGVLCCLELGLRASEVLGLSRRDLDRGILFVEGTKTESARRRIRLPESLHVELERLARLHTDGPLIRTSRQHLYHFCIGICRRADVPVVGLHALRGTHASLAVLGGASVEAVARVLGHARTDVTRKHYVSPDAEQAARVDATQQVLKNIPESFPPQ
jgi:integrase